MRSMQNMTTILGSLALIWTLVLVSPGVRVVRAEEGSAASAAGEVAEGGTCEVGADPGGHATVDSLQKIQRAKIAQLADAMKHRDPGADYIDLNNRGFNQPRPGEQPSAH